MLKKLISLLLAISLLLSALAVLVGCNEGPSGDEGGTTPPPNTPTPPKDPPIGTGGDPMKPLPTVVVPAVRDYGRGTVDFDELIYERPDFNTLIASIDAITASIDGDTMPFEEQLAAIVALDGDFKSTMAMYTLAEILYYRDMNDKALAAEYEYVSEGYPRLIKSTEELMVAAARSENAELFEEQYFGDGLIEKYEGGGVYTDELITLLECEASLENDYSSLSIYTVEITHNGKTATVDVFLDEVAERYATNKDKREQWQAYYLQKYYYAALARSRDIFTELVRTRILIADEMGLESYAELAYSDLEHSYSISDTEKMLGDIRAYITEMYPELEAYAFESHFSTIDTAVDRVTLLNTMYGALEEQGGDIFDAYCYMLQHGLYDVKSGSERFNGAFTTYIETNSSPFLFVTLSGFTRDYLTLSHEFGHFFEAYVNNGMHSTLDVAEISSQALELLSLTLLEDRLEHERYSYLRIEAMYDAVSTLLSQSFLASVEHKIYALEADEVTAERLNELTKEASLAVYGTETYNRIDYAIITHTVRYPFYVQSYVTSLIPALEIFFAELEEEGEGMRIYKELISLAGSSASLPDVLASLGLSSPFESETVREIANSIYTYLTGKSDKYKAPVPEAA